MTEDTLPKLLIRNAKKYGHSRHAMREKDFGIWQSFTWQDYFEHVKYFALGMAALGVKKDDKIAIIGDNRPEWIYTELAAQCLGAVPIGIYQDSILKEVSYIIDLAKAKLVVGEDQEQVDKILDMQEDMPSVEKIIYHDPKGMYSYDDSMLLFFPDVEAMGREFELQHPDFFEEQVNAAHEDDVAAICTTSGTTGNPKLSLLSHRNLLRMAKNLGEVDPKKESDDFVSFLPLPWIGEQMMAISSALLFGFTVNFPEKPETAQDDIREIGPHVMFSPPRVWENMAAMVQVKIMDASPMKRFFYNKCLPIGYQWADFKFQKKQPGFMDKLKYKIAYWLVFRALKDRLGFTNIRSASTGGAALGPDTFRFFHALGVNLKQIYGQTEIAGISCIHRDGDVDFDSVGIPIPETEIKITEEGEIISRSPSLFLGYYENQKATDETIIDGWLHSGDAGYFNDKGHLVVIDRVKDVMTLRDGTKFSPQFIENKLKFSPYIKEAVAIGHMRDYIVAMICIDYPIVGKWAENNRLAYTTYTDLAYQDPVYEMIEREVVRVNEALPESARIEKFILLYKELDADDDELTRTRKVRRGFVDQKYNEIIEGMYLGKENIPIETKIKYQDGSVKTLKVNIKVKAFSGGGGK
ncbi:MAG: long-chain fatty acid--CoA ligase [Deltaproteobacteria bacterium]|nr:long-chain fatty acid--CoA ligase [Candidatus Anaeroferrophillus wilburensis]MBN2888834.1 long-chain fatty acid--CoA ligase [Deltaproteobacteria bacterium]